MTEAVRFTGRSTPPTPDPARPLSWGTKRLIEYAGLRVLSLDPSQRVQVLEQALAKRRPKA